MRSRSTDHLNYSGKENIDSGTLKRMLKGFHPGTGPQERQGRDPSDNSPLTSPEGGGAGLGGQSHSGTVNRATVCMSSL